LYVYRFFASAHLESRADLIRGEIVDDEVDNLVQVVVHEALALAGNRGGHLIAKSLQNVPKGNVDKMNITFP
jgi:hypothetical protein